MSEKLINLDNLTRFKEKQDAQIDRKLEEKQDVLQSGVNVKTINGESILGSGDMDYRYRRLCLW